MPKRLVLCSDGTGNSSAKAEKTNVWRIFQALDQTEPDQLAHYDDGVGTSSNKYLAALGGAFGYGLKRNVIDLYKFVCRVWKPGDEIYGFGFSRGAYTIRVVVA
ncbi:phospholipase effector Tle1 domain-containing protein, partial [Roseateles sp. P5_E11]